jgi:hypothetical protein
MVSTDLKRLDAVLVLTTAVSSVVLSGVLLEAVTDRDWSVRGWEWPEVLVAASVLALGALWLITLRPSPESLEGESTVKRLVKSELERHGYRLSRVPPLASQPDHALDVDFEYVLAHYLARREPRLPFFFVQIGALDGVSFDRLHKHIVDGRWHGVLVEPQAEPFERLVANYEGLQGLTFINAAVDMERGSRPLFVIEDNAGKSNRVPSRPRFLLAEPPRGLASTRRIQVSGGLQDRGYSRRLRDVRRHPRRRRARRSSRGRCRGLRPGAPEGLRLRSLRTGDCSLRARPSIEERLGRGSRVASPQWLPRRT